jgi:hypothetical protein
VNVWGVVNFIKPVFKTRGTDYCCNLMLVDESLQANSAEGFKCNLFHKARTAASLLCGDRAVAGSLFLFFSSFFVCWQNPEKLPLAKQPGDIIRIHRLKRSQWDGVPQGLSSLAMSAVSFGQTGSVPYQRMLRWCLFEVCSSRSQPRGGWCCLCWVCSV